MCVCAPVYVLTQGVCAYVYVLAQESCGKSRFPGPSTVLILRSGQENLYSEADGLLSHVEIPEIFLSLKNEGLLLTSGEGNGTPLQYSCLENPIDGGAWKAVVHGVAEGRTRLSDFTFTFHFHALEKKMATHSSVLAWRIPEMGKPGGLPSMRSHRIGHD